MTTIKNITILGLLAAFSAFAQLNTLTQTTTSAAIGASDQIIYLSSITNIVAYNPSTATQGTRLYIVDPGEVIGEVMDVQSIVSTANKALGVRRGGPQQGYSGSTGQGTGLAHASGAMVLYGPPGQFYGTNPTGACTAATTYVTPWVNITNGDQWLCSTVTKTWVPGFGNTEAPGAPTAAVASAAGLITPSGPLFHVTGALAITGFNIPVGFNGGGFCIIPDGTFTTTTANNIALASTAVVSKELCYAYDANAAKPFFPVY
jgi:hypothetical protein